MLKEPAVGTISLLFVPLDLLGGSNGDFLMGSQFTFRSFFNVMDGNPSRWL